MNHETTEPFNQEPEDFSDAAIERARRALDETPEMIGPYRIIERLGAGGMGEVYRADQKEPIRRQVAIKLIKLGMDTRQVVARFEAERQALAMMDHPNIARVFDAGTTDDGRPYFVMEYVKGVPLTEYCDSARLPLRERLKLFIPVCQAVQHAHQKGIVHRDLKPSNILICLYDGRPVPKVIDFGLAKALYQPLTEQTIYTKHGMMVGTPLYMSPEQAEQNNLDIDTRTDIYSLGVVLYELLTGSTPLELEQLRVAAYNEVLRLIKEVEPPKPSARLSSNASLPSVAAQRGIEPKQLSRAVSGDLDWIVMKALDKERSRRYETASGFARDVERFLNDEAVEACPPSRSYRLKRFVYKHKGQVLAASAVLCALVFGLAATSWQWLRARQAEHAAIASKEIAIEARDQATKERDAKNEALVAEAAQREIADKQRDLAERNYVEGLLRTVGTVEWSAIADSRLKLRVLEIGFEKPETAMELSRLEQEVIQACVGLSPSRRAFAIKLMSVKQRDMTADPRIRVAALWLAIELGSTDTPAYDEALRWLSNVDIVASKPREEFEAFVDFLTLRMNSLRRDQITSCGELLIAVMKHSVSSSIDSEARELGLFAPKLSSEQVGRGFEALIGAVKSDRYFANHRTQALAPFVSKEQITRAGDELISILEKSTDFRFVRDRAVPQLVSLAEMLSPDQTRRAWEAAIALLEEEKSRHVWDRVDNILTKLAPRLTEEQATRGGDSLLAVLEKGEKESLRASGKSLVALAPRLSANQIARTSEVIIAALKDHDLFYAATDVLVDLSPYLNSEKLTDAWEYLIADVEHSSNGIRIGTIGSTFVELAPGLSPEQLKRTWESLIIVFNKSTSENAFYSYRIAKLVRKLSPEQVAYGWDAIIEVLEKSMSKSDAAREALVALVSLDPNLSPEQIMRGWDSLVAVLKTDDHDNVKDCLVALAPKLSSEQTKLAADSLFAIVQESSSNENAVCAAFWGLVALAPNLSHEKINRIAELLAKSLHRVGIAELNDQIQLLAPHLEFEMLTQISTAALTAFLDDLLTLPEVFAPPYDSSRTSVVVAQLMSSQRALAELLKHPSAIGKPQEWQPYDRAAIGEPRERMLQRFEELVFHNGQRVFLPLPLPNENTVGSDKQTSASKPEPPPRRFHTIHDAAAWIQHNWPDFDLDAPYPVTLKEEGWE